MRKISLLAVAMILVGGGVWATTTNPTPHDAPVGISFNPLEGLNTRDVPTLEFVNCAYLLPPEGCTEPRLIYPRYEPNATASRSGP